jgi:hypothetical protein
MRHSICVGTLFALLLTPHAGFAQEQESLVRWPHNRELTVPDGNPALAEFLLDTEILGAARQDLGDLRLYDSANKEVAYALRILRDSVTVNDFEAHEFNRGVRGMTAELSLDLGATPADHNQVEIQSAGENFRRNVDVDGSHDGKDWARLESNVKIFHFSSAGRSASVRTVNYPVSRYRYLRIRVDGDPEGDSKAPVISHVRVRKTFEVKGQKQTYPAMLEKRDEVRDRGRAASVYRIDLGGTVPLEGLRLEVAESGFSRPYRLESDDRTYRRNWRIEEGEIERRAESSASAVPVQFQENSVRRLKLTVIDDRNPPLTITGVSGFGSARQIVFEPKAAAPGPVRIYYGYQKTSAPNYDFASSLGDKLPSEPVRVALGPQVDNPIYEPEPQPLTERSPWLIYGVLVLAALVLLAILRNLAKSVRKGAATSTSSEDTA